MAIKELLLNAKLEVNHLKFLIKDNLNMIGPIVVLPFIGYSNGKELRMRGRILEQEGVVHQEPDDNLNLTKNLHRFLKRYESDEIPNEKITFTIQNARFSARTNQEGFFNLTYNVSGFDLDKLDPDNDGLIQVKLELPETDFEISKFSRHTARFFYPTPKTEFGIISDVDDTIIRSSANDTFQKLKTMLLNNARTRSPFAGGPVFYNALKKGKRGKANNPVFYVSGSSWNLYDLLEDFCHNHDIPIGPFFLRELGLDENKIMRTDTMQHKIQVINDLFKFYPEMKFILIGDSGQRDADIYHKIALQHPDRVMAIYIRDIDPAKADPMIKNSAKALNDKGIDVIHAQDTDDAAIHAESQGWISASQLQEVKDVKQKEDFEPVAFRDFLPI